MWRVVELAFLSFTIGNFTSESRFFWLGKNFEVVKLDFKISKFLKNKKFQTTG